MQTAYNLLRPEPHYRSEAFSSGLAAAGYEVRHCAPVTIKAGDVVLSWSRYGANHDICTRVERAGGIALIAENAYLGPGGVSPHGMNPRTWYALARGYHNDSSVIPEGDGSRWAALGVDLKPWRADGGHVLILPNRPFGAPGRSMPPNWAQDVAARLRKLTKREIRIRAHPGNAAPVKPLADDLAEAWCTVIWSSSAGVHSLIAGVPVICEAPFWICKTDVKIADIVAPPMPDRLPALQRLACGQFNLQEIESGFAVTSVLRRAEETQVAACA